ncbi:putative toxin-antitoxin system toxin component, PIN family [Flavisolibacter ginsenosidimutans]|uniref:Putative toxin-antitoxin system toxin component, PIN family n=1 Tax=Flavisolibacter ginsenosidimutans TaxID=661481 RepID=A0A5B8UNA4_9BACT|nr:putative toxin-antitoxin system toxin component, PIN family [Flavisolibacter ginsenosidimutans]QEC58058.1 putative toxin-antitoxin system toxin component, PIN family [Flavisolibacter ginsenosidimutans]
MKGESTKVIFDTNVWISFLIGKRLASLQKYIVSNEIIIVTTNQLLTEIREVTSRERLKKYFPKESVLELLQLLETIAAKVEVQPTHFINRDPKDNFLLDLIDFSKADYLVTGDKDLLLHNPFKTATILTPAEFEKILERM